MTSLAPETVDISEVEIIDVMTTDEARTLTAELRSTTARSWAIVADIDSRRGFKALGYDSLTAWGKAELGYSASYVSRLASQGEVIGSIQALPIGNPETVALPNEAQARELAPLKDDPQALAAIWARATATEQKPTANAVRALVNNVRPDLAHRKPVGRPRKDTTTVSGPDPEAVATEAAAIADPVIRAAMEAAHEPAKGVIRTFGAGVVLTGDGTGEALPPLPDSAYPPDAQPLDQVETFEDLPADFAAAVDSLAAAALRVVALWEHGTGNDRVEAVSIAASVVSLASPDPVVVRNPDASTAMVKRDVQPIAKTGRKK